MQSRALAGLANLRELGISNNEIVDVRVLGSTITLQRLDLRNNRIEDVRPLEGLGEVESIDVRGNPVDCEGLEHLVSALGRDIVARDSCNGHSPP